MVYLEDEIRGVLASLGGSQTSPDVVMARYGWSGRAPTTLQEVGDEFGVTRERVRQVCALAQKRIRAGRFHDMPRLDAALVVLRASLPCTSTLMKEKLAESGFSSLGIGGEGLLAAASFFGRDVDVTIVPVRAERLMIDIDLAGRVGKARQAARKLIGSHGVATASEVAAEVWAESSDAEHEIYEEIVKLELDLEPDVVWLDEEKRWLWIDRIPDGRNRLLNNIKKVLSVTGIIEASDLRKAVRRDWRMGGYAPPVSVLLALADAVPELKRVGTMVEGINPYSKEAHLSNSEYIIAGVLLENGAVMKYEDLERVVTEYGVGLASFRRRISHSPIVLKYAPGVYGLSGLNVSGATVDALVSPAKRSRVLQDCGWSDNGRVWVAYHLNRSVLTAAVLGVPAAVRDFVSGEHRLVDGAGRGFGTLIVKDYAAWGVRRLLRMSGAELGDTLLLVFDLNEHECRCYIGDESVRDEVLSG